MNGKPEKWCWRCGGKGTWQGKPCPCLTVTAPIPAPVPCPGKCGSRVRVNADGTINHHGSLGWSCDGKTVRRW